MNSPDPTSARRVLLIVAVVVPIAMYAFLGFALSSLMGLGSGKTPVYPVSYEQARLTQQISGYFMLPLAMFTGLLAFLNIKLRKESISTTLMLLCAIFICWAIYGAWALNGKLVSQPVHTAPSDQTLKIRTIDLQ